MRKKEGSVRSGKGGESQEKMNKWGREERSGKGRKKTGRRGKKTGKNTKRGQGKKEWRTGKSELLFHFPYI